MLTQTISAPAGRALNERPTQIPHSADQFGALAVCAGLIAHRIHLQEGRGDLRRGRARRIRLSGGPWRRSHLQAAELTDVARSAHFICRATSSALIPARTIA